MDNDKRQTWLSINCEVVPRPSTDYRAPAIEPLDQEGRYNCWNKLFEWGKSDIYRFFLLDLPEPLQINQSAGTDYHSLIGDPPPRMIIKWSPPHLAAKNAYVSVSIPRAMEKPKPNLLSEQYCVVLDGIGVTCPEVAAHVCSAGFAAGLVCRLTLASLLQNAAGIPSFGVSASQIKKLQDSSITSREIPAAPYERAIPWPEFVKKIMAAAPFEASGMFHGWQAGSQLSEMPEDDYRKAAWRLIRGRFSWDEIGELSGYVLSYIVGYLRCQDVLHNFADTRKEFSAANVIEALRADDQIAATETILCGLYGALLEQLPKVSAENQNAGEKFRQLLTGFQRGELRASELVFRQALSLGYGLGYRDGFDAGYTRGYVDGYREGYNEGMSDFWNSLFTALKEVRKIVSTVETIKGFLAYLGG